MFCKDVCFWFFGDGLYWMQVEVKDGCFMVVQVFYIIIEVEGYVNQGGDEFMNLWWWNIYVIIRWLFLILVYIWYNLFLEDQKCVFLQGMLGLFIVEYDVERIIYVGEVMVRYGYIN